MSYKVFLSMALLMQALFVGLPSSFAGTGDLSVTNGMGEEMSMKKSLFGKKELMLKDRYSNRYSKKENLAGGKETELNFLGNELKSKKGLLGSKMEGSTIFGDKVTSKKGFFGRRKTTLDLSGSANLLKSALKRSPQSQNSLPPGWTSP